MATSLVTCCATSLGWCFCSACTSLLGSCCGNDKPSTVAPGPTSGRKRSVVVLVMCIALALGFQFGVAAKLVDSDNIAFTYLRDAWVDGCEEFEDDPDLQKSCAGNNGNYRASAATTLFFLLAAIAAACKPTANREAWPSKYILYLFLVAATIFIPNEPLFAKIFLNVARIGGILFVIIQQIVILDCAHNWNDSWVENANKAEQEEIGSGKKWLGAILASCAILFLGSIGVLIYMFVDFTGCASNNAFIILTLIFCVILTAAQMSGEEGSLLSSACISAWATFLCYSAVSKNPDKSCNPILGQSNPLSIVFGLVVTIISLAWAGWSYTAEDKLRLGKDGDDEPQLGTNDPEAGRKSEKKKVTGIVTGGDASGTSEDATKNASLPADATDDDSGAEEESADRRLLSNSWRLNIALAAVACWSSMILTHWGEIQSDGTIANPSVGRIGMWMIIGSQWLVIGLYIWTLVAPRLFPDRDFS